MKNRKGFTLIELIVVMAIIGALVLLASPKYKEYTKDAHLTRIKVNIKELEQASQKYYMTNNKWPRLTDAAYTAEELKEYSDRILDKTGEEIELVEGNYYDIDYSKLSNYVKVPDDKENYILRNPVGKIYYFDGLTNEGYARVNYGVDNPNKSVKGKSILTNEEITAKINEGYIPIATAEELNNIRYNSVNTFGRGSEWEGEYLSGLKGKYIQIKDIDLSVYSEVEGWEPIGDSTNVFGGTYDGNGLIISNLYINNATGGYQGLFGRISKGNIENLGLVNCDLLVSTYSGVLAGDISNSIIKNIHVEGSIKGFSNAIGGVIGNTSNSIIENSYALVEVSGNVYVGGLVGFHTNSEVTNCFYLGEISANSEVGSIVGYLSNAHGLFSRVNYSYAFEPGIQPGIPVVGGRGAWSNGGSLNRNIVTASKLLINDEFKQQSSFEGWDFDNIWEIKLDDSHPTFKWQN